MRHIITPHLILINSTKVLLLKRSVETKLFGGYWHLPTGMIENEEDPMEALLREVKEELSIDLNMNLESVIPTHVPDFIDPKKKYHEISMFFSAFTYDGEVRNNEPKLHSEIGWFDLNSLPEPTIPVVKFGLKCFQERKLYSKFMV